MQEDCSLIAEIAVWLWRLPSEMSGMREISERKANDLNFLNPVLSTNQRPQFWALNQWEASISGPPILTHFQNQTAISAIRQPSQQWDCNLSNHTAILLHCSLIVEIAVRLWRLQSVCWYCSLILEVSQNQRTWNRGFPLVEGQKSRPLIGWKDRIKKIQGISLSFRNLFHSTHSRWQSPQSDCNLYKQTAICIIRLQSPQFDSNLYNQTVISTIKL